MAFGIVAILSFSVSGCKKAEQSSGPQTGNSVKASLEETDSAGLAQAVARHRGNVVLVDYWATWCRPCKILFPHTVELHNRFADKGLAVITVSTDGLDAVDDVRAFLSQHHATTENYLITDPRSLNNITAIPYIQVIDRNGKIYRSIVGNQPDEIEKAVIEALDAKLL
jgi:thiol-disulfide isomerase/thioredoxin